MRELPPNIHPLPIDRLGQKRRERDRYASFERPAPVGELTQELRRRLVVLESNLHDDRTVERVRAALCDDPARLFTDRELLPPGQHQYLFAVYVGLLNEAASADGMSVATAADLTKIAPADRERYETAAKERLTAAVEGLLESEYMQEEAPRLTAGVAAERKMRAAA